MAAALNVFLTFGLTVITNETLVTYAKCYVALDP